MEQTGKEGHKDSQALLNDYYDTLVERLESGKPLYFSNSDRSHNAMVMKFMLNKSSIINMYCGEMSVFRKSFYDHIEKDSSELIARNLIDDISRSLDLFLNKDDVQFNIIVETYKEEYLNDLICGEAFSLGIREKKINLFKLKDDSFKNKFDHFTVSDAKLVRLEEDKDKHIAICSLNHDDIYHRAKTSFLKMMSISEPIPVS